MYSEDNNNGSNNGNKGKWSERLFRMKKYRKKKDINISNDDKISFRDVGRNVLKIVLIFPSVVYSFVKGNTKCSVENNISKKNVNYKKKIKVDKININKNNVKSIDIRNKTSRFDVGFEKYRNKDVSLIKDIDVALLKRNREYNLKNFNVISNNLREKKIDNIDFELRKIELQREIVNLIKKKLVKNINELEMLQSDFYILDKINNDDVYLNKCMDDVKEVKKLLSKIKSLKEKYDCLKENVDFEYMLEYDDDYLVDKILELKDICSRSDIKQIIDDYKILEEYKYLYLKIDKLQENIIKYEEYKNDKVEELKQRDIDFDKMKEQLYDIDRENERYDDFVKKQELLLNELNEKVHKIDSYEKITFRLKGFNQLLGNSFKYLGLLLVNPLKGIVPGIVNQTLVTKNIVSNLYKNLEWEENKKLVYDAIDYSTEINMAINNLDSTSLLVDATLEDVIRLKSKYINEFSQYEVAFSSYKEVIKKLNKMENAIIGNKIKIEKIRENMLKNERLNQMKMKKVKRFNDLSDI